MLVGDGVTPSNEGRGYVLRRMLRRVIRNARLLGADEPVMRELVQQALDVMAPSYPELADQAQRILAVAVAEEESFAQTLRSGTQRFEIAAGEATANGSTVLDGARAFELHDTFGFPIDLTLEMAADAGLTVDEDGLPPADGRAAQGGQGRTRTTRRSAARRRVRLPRPAGRRCWAPRRSPATPG